MTSPTQKKDISNRLLRIEIWVPFIIGGIAAIFAYGQLSADVGYKANKSDVEVMAVQISTIARDVAENKASIKEGAATAQDNHDILIKIQAKLGID